ncbi:MAG: phage portal protein [Pseudolabrys sp.]|nr:phage portal protein [Pseudolabrys sp.]
MAKIFGGSGTPNTAVAASKDAPRSRLQRLRARYDAAADAPENRKHWANADALSPNAALSPNVRRTLRIRSRYEIANNSYAKGIVDTLAHDIIGIGPQLQVNGPNSEAIEALWNEWARSVSFADKLRLTVRSAAESGEVFLRFVRNDMVMSRVQLDLRLYEADQVAAPGLFAPLTNGDGIEFDGFGNPLRYSILKAHPGSGSSDSLQADPVPASQVIHYFRMDRPGQLRGIPWMTPALPLFAQLRRFTLAALTAAETAASIALAIGTDAPAQDDGQDPEAMDTFDLERGSVTVLPPGYKLSQVQPAQPTASYEMFKREILNEMARCLNMPFNIAAGNSSSYNYASGRLDHQTYDLSIRVLRAHIEAIILDRLFAEFYREAVAVARALPGSVRLDAAIIPTRTWIWQSREHVDPAKEASGQQTRLLNGTTTLRAECAERGDDWREVLAQRARERDELARLGLSLTPISGAPPGTPASDGGKSPDTNEEPKP